MQIQNHLYSKTNHTTSWNLQDLPAAELVILGVLFIGTKTTIASVPLIDALSYGLIMLGTGFALLRLGAVVRSIFSSLLAILIYLIGCGISYFISPGVFPPENIIVMLVVISCGSVAISTQGSIFQNRFSVNLTLFISGVYLALTTYAQGLVFEGSPQFIFDTFDDYGLRVYEVYSQGISKLFGILCLISLNYYMMLGADKNTNRIYLFSSILFFMVCLIGGARGELLALVLCIALHLVNFKSPLPIIFGVLMIGVLSVLPQHIQDQFVVLDRLSALSEDDTLGGRRELFSNSLLLINSNKICLLTGCGLQFFQDFWGYRISQYPHNYFLDLAISYGVIVTSAIYFIYFKAIYASRENGSWTIFGYISLYLFIVSMKSGSPSVDHLFWILLARQIQLIVGRPHLSLK